MTSTTNHLTTFSFNAHQVRAVTDERGEPWFIAKDICDALGMGTTGGTQHWLDGLDPDEVRLFKQQEFRGLPNRGANAVSESGLYGLVMRSRKPEAKEFRKWVTSEVLPSIRKHGGYVAPTTNAAEAFVSHYLPNLSEQAKKEIVMGLSKRVDELEAEKAFSR